MRVLFCYKHCLRQRLNLVRSSITKINFCVDSPSSLINRTNLIKIKIFDLTSHSIFGIIKVIKKNRI